jgi:hypothetical protein
MAAYFVRSLATGSGTGASWTNAYTTLVTAFSGKAAGDIFWVADDHAETQASAMTLTGPGTISNPALIYCADRTQASPGTGDLRTTATITTTGAFAMTINGNAYYYGITFNCGSGAVSSVLTLGGTGTLQRYDSCSLRKLGTTGSATAINTVATSVFYLNSTTMQFGSTSDFIALNGTVIWENTAGAITGATLPVSLIFPASGNIANVKIRGVDFSALGSSITLASLTNATRLQIISFIDCRLPASVIFSGAAAASVAGPDLTIIRCDSGATNYRHERYKCEGTQTVETTIVRTGGATDGTTPISWKIVSTSGSRWLQPYESIPISIWNDTTGSKTVTIYGTTTTGSTVPNNDDIWIEAEYLGASGNPQGSFITTTKANNLAAAATTNNSSDASTWGGGGAGRGFKMVTPSFTVNQKGYITVTVKVAKVSSTYYVDPFIVVT